MMFNKLQLSDSFIQTDFLSNNAKNAVQEKETSQSTFAQMLDGVNETQNNALNSVYNLIATGEGELSQVLIELQQAQSQMRTASVIRDNVIEGYRQLVNVQM